MASTPDCIDASIFAHVIADHSTDFLNTFLCPSPYTSVMVTITLASLEWIVNHVVLPPKLPQKAEEVELSQTAERHLTSLLLEAVQDYRCQLADEAISHKSWRVIKRMLAHFNDLISTPSLQARTLVRSFALLKASDVLPIQLRAQNAVLVLRKTDEVVIFECFEASPKAESVMSANGNLIRHFPAHAVALPLTVFTNEKFQHELAHRLSQLDAEVIEEMMPQSHKAGSWTGEVRDTAHPGLVTEMLMSTIAALGKPVKVRQIRKRTRDDVLWDNTLLPWRRSPTWLAIRVTIQATLAVRIPNRQCTVEYKNFVLFVLADIASRAFAAKMPADLCYITGTKIARRASKLGADTFGFVQEKALKVCQAVRIEQDRQWQSVQEEDKSRRTTVERCAFDRDTALTLKASKPYLDAILDRNHDAVQAQADFAPDCQHWLGWADDLPTLRDLGYMTKDEITYGLAELEAWTSRSLPAWIQQRLASSYSCEHVSSNCMALFDLASEYRRLALVAYSEAPEQLSIMILVIAEIWYALDRLATQLVPLLSEFPPSLPSNLFEPLLLSKLSQMDRLRKVELHIGSRQAYAKRSNPSIFSDPTQKGFAVQYYAISPRHQTLRRRIEEDALVERTSKEAEWKTSTDTYERLKDEAKRKSCNNVRDSQGDPHHVRAKCKKCALNDEADSMAIGVHEWPLPDDESSSIFAIFELDCPVELVAWRNLTWLLVQDLGRDREFATASPAVRLPSYAGLKNYATDNGSRLSLASTTKPFVKAHYGTLKFPILTVERCFAKNALHYQLFDVEKGGWVKEQEQWKPPNFHDWCITPLPDGPYSSLQYAVNSVQHSQNHVIADQESCSEALSLHEFLSFGSLRSDGERVQWYNIKRELAASNLSLNTESVCTLVTQAALQVGSQADSNHRNSHLDLADSAFCKELLSTIVQILNTIQANWKSDYTIQVLIIVTLRVLSLCPDPEVTETALDLLRDMRNVAYEWTKSISAVLHKTTDLRPIFKLQERLLKTAIVCKLTFDTDESYINRSMATESDLSIWVISSVHVRENTQNSAADIGQDTRRLMMREKKVTHTMYPLVRRLVVEEASIGLNTAINQVWTGFQPGSDRWHVLDLPRDRWLFTNTASSDQRISQTVHYNILDGELLVDGKPLGRLPKHYVSNVLYIRVLGAQILHVFSSDMPGMVYMSAQRMGEYDVHFGMRGEEMVIKIKNDSHVLELFPHFRFNDDLPSSFIDQHIHWLNIAAREIEFRPLDQKWTSSHDNWHLLYRPKAKSSLVRGDKELVDPHSSIATAVLEIFGALESLENIHVSNSEGDNLEVALPRYDLHFFLNRDGFFECHELCKIVDPNQSVGTMIGLKNRLVLCGTLPLAQKHDRLLVIPEGEVLVVRKGFHVQANITVSGSSIRLFRYQIDATLHRLQGSGDAQGTIYKALLHAVTSNNLPDPFTGLTGTEEAISHLRQTSLGFTKPPDTKTIGLLTAISRLTPHRTFYPSHLRVMQQVVWHPALSMLAQHDDFLSLAQRIVASGDAYLVFYPDSAVAPNLLNGRSSDLLTRTKTRNGAFRSCSFGHYSSLNNLDKSYVARDRPSVMERSGRSFEIASLIRQWPDKLETSRSLSTYLSSLGTISNFGTKFDAYKPLSQLLEVAYESSWGPLHSLCRASLQDLDNYRLLFLFSAIAYGRGVTSLEILRTLLAFSFLSNLREVPTPSTSYSYFTPLEGHTLNKVALRATIKSEMIAYHGPTGRKYRAQWQVGHDKHEKECKQQTEAVYQHYKTQWPSTSPSNPSQSLASHLNWSSCPRAVSTLFFVWMANGEYRRYLNDVQPILDDAQLETAPLEYASAEWHTYEGMPTFDSVGRLPPSLDSLVLGDAPISILKQSVLTIQRRLQVPRGNDKLRALIGKIRSPSETYNRYAMRAQYRDDLLASCEAFSTFKEQINPATLPCPLHDIVLNRMVCESHASELLSKVHDMLGPSKDTIGNLLELGGLWPRLTLRSVLVLLSTNVAVKLSEPLKDYLLMLGEAVTIAQRARRLVLAAERQDISTFCMELENEGHKGWSVTRWPDWLLIEIESDFLIRPTQARVALEMIQPSSNMNSLVQLNMGEGKSSVIVPLVAVAIADGTRLSRIIVLKSLVKQMRDTIYQRLGGLVDRPLFFMPFSRKVQMDPAAIVQIQALQQSCMECRGILLAQPEHLLSFKLMGIERLTSGDLGIASQLLMSQSWLETHARDILDESDELLDVKFQLIYTLGSQRMMDGQPDRWLITQGIFDLVEKHARVLESEHPTHIEIKHHSDSSFPHLRILSAQVGDALVLQIAHDIIDSKIPSVNFERCSESRKAAALRFLLNREVSNEDCNTLKQAFGDRESFLQKLLMLRGLIAYRILLFVLRSKRWSVNYGLHPFRCLSAVPYRAKGVPSPSAEFGHPDVAIALTCMSYYHSGLTNAQFRTCLELLQKSDDPSVEYASWTKRCKSLPRYLCSWTAVNLEDDRQFYEELFPNLRYGKKVADFFMAHVVFPKEGKEFDEKLSTSGWDVVSKKGPHVTTGFSGTNDNRFVLPLSISQQDLPELKHTSGKVLDFVLREENQVYHCARDERGRQLSTEALLRCLAQIDSTVRVLIDVGAQVLDTCNHDLVKAWMELAPDVDAGVYFDEDDNVMVLSKDMKVEKLAVSSHQNRMDRCVVYLDEVHTRGTDLKLPPTARAVVTLGPRLTKDRLVQACMRLRKLAYGQSLLFLAPPEVHQSILALTGKSEAELDAYDVVAWSLEQSCSSIERSQPLRILQGLNYNRRQTIMDNFLASHSNLSNLATEIDLSSDFIKAFREKEEQRLNDLYAPLPLKINVNPGIVEISRGSTDQTVQILLEMWDGLDSTASAGASMHEEHEREVAHEIETETQVERPPKVKALPRAVDPLLQTFVRAGRLEDLMRFPLAYDRIVKLTSAVNPALVHPWSHLRVTNDFTNTVQRPSSGYYDNYIRPANWVLTSKVEVEPGSILLLSQYEANELLRDIQKVSSGVRLHIYEPRVTKSMASVDFGLGPPSPSIEEWRGLTSGVRRELNLFAGQVYFNTYKDYQKSCKDLGPRLNPSVDQTLSFLKAWIAIRRKGQNFNETHLGQMVNGRAIVEEMFE